jgi:hypothetical protein
MPETDLSSECGSAGGTQEALRLLAALAITGQGPQPDLDSLGERGQPAGAPGPRARSLDAGSQGRRAALFVT